VNVSSRSLKTSAFCASTRPHVLRAAGKFCENQFKACSLSAIIRHAYGHLFLPKTLQKSKCEENAIRTPQTILGYLFNIRICTLQTPVKQMTYDY